jgi:predicted nucleotide-binding protein (sugar kinase/HSP70/actin superfamily)
MTISPLPKRANIAITTVFAMTSYHPFYHKNILSTGVKLIVLL